MKKMNDFSFFIYQKSKYFQRKNSFGRFSQFRTFTSHCRHKTRDTITTRNRRKIGDNQNGVTSERYYLPGWISGAPGPSVLLYDFPYIIRGVQNQTYQSSRRGETRYLHTFAHRSECAMIEICVAKQRLITFHYDLFKMRFCFTFYSRYCDELCMRNLIYWSVIRVEKISHFRSFSFMLPR